ncbi:glycosyltransferase family 2 protein (plasmid) [Rhizobium phaseoli]|uniref:glycosyltransferase family 2 protein n=1 Tax=Rhizobium phaseoli TaxID=396 RepID=UPI0007EBFA12|nr:glycosyltransferase family A protein [Rhizobium phaseoli]ANL30170.1 glycosyltransferase family 2 protein [Rhizobium phaseoli]
MASCSAEDRGETVHLSAPLVSVVVPAFNASPYIERTLRSAVQQTYANLEIIVVNDGSTDDTARLVEKMAAVDPRIRLLSTSNRGVAAARNTGIEASSGLYVAFLDADDLWHRTKIEKQVNALHRLSQDWAAVYVLHHIINRDDEIVCSYGSHVARGYIYARHLTFKYVANGSALLVRREVALEIGGFDSSYASAGIGGCEDLDFELRLAARYLIEVIPERLVGYRQYPGNMSSNHLQMGKGALEVVKRSLAANHHLPHYAARSAMNATRKYAYWQFRRAKCSSLSVMLLWSMLRTEPFFVVQRILQKGLRWLQQESGSATIQYSDPPVRSKFDLQIIPQVEPPDESRRSRRNLVRLAAVDAKLNLFPEP